MFCFIFNKDNKMNSSASALCAYRRPCVSSLRGSHGSWATRCCFARVRTRRVPSVAATPSSPPVPTRRGTSPAAWSWGTSAAPTLSAGETWFLSGSQSGVTVTRWLYFFSLSSSVLPLSLLARPRKKPEAARLFRLIVYALDFGRRNQWNESLKCIIGNGTGHTWVRTACVIDK